VNETRRIARLLEIKAAAEKARKRLPRSRKVAKRAWNSARRAKIRGQICTCCSAAAVRAVHRAATLMHAEVDHILPLALGGLHCVRNLQILSYADHKAKTAKDLRIVSQVRQGKLSFKDAVAYMNKGK